MKIMLGIGVASLAIACVWIIGAATSPDAGKPAPPSVAATEGVASRPAWAASSAPVAQAVPAAVPSAAIAASQPTPPAVIPAAVSMAEARERGDDRMPPLDTTSSNQPVPAPTPWELGDEQRYLAYEQREQQRVRAAYLRAADESLPQWRAAINEARARGMPAEDIAKAEEKVQRLEAMQAELKKREASGGR